MLISALVAIAANAWTGSQQPPLLTWSGGPAKGRIAITNVLAIVKAGGPVAVSDRKMRPSHTGIAAFGAEPFTVVSGLGCTKGDVLKAVFPHFDNVLQPLPPPAFDNDKRYLLLAVRPEGGELSFPLNEAAPPYALIVDLHSADEVAAMFVIETPAKELAGDGDLLRRLYPAVIACMASKDDETVRRACRFLREMPPGSATRPSALPYGYPPTTTYCPEDDTVRAVKAQLAKASPYGRSLIWGLLLRWRVPGAEEAYRNTLVALAGVSGPYEGQFDRDELIVDYQDYAGIDGSCPLDADAYLRVIGGARNHALLLHFLLYYGAMLSEEQCRSLASLLRSSDQEVRYLVIRQLVLSTRDKDHDAVPAALVNGAIVEYPGLDQQVAYWMHRYGISPP